MMPDFAIAHPSHIASDKETMKKYYSINFVYCFLLICVAVSCSRSVYKYTDVSGHAEFIIYKHLFNYKEKTAFTDFCTSGNYTIKDSMITFEFQEPDKLPYSYLASRVSNIEKEESDQIEIKVIDFKSHEPLLFATVIVRDSADNIIKGLETSLEGIVHLKKNKKSAYLEIQYVGHTPTKIPFDTLRNYNFVLAVGGLAYGGRLMGSCLLTYVDVLVKYKIDSLGLENRLGRNRVVFRQDKVRIKKPTQTISR